MKYISLVLLVVQNASLALTMRAARTQTGDMFFATSAVCMAELTKVIVCLIIILHSFGWNFKLWLQHIQDEIIRKPLDTLKVAVPAFIYTVQNNLLYISISNLPAAVFQVRTYLIIGFFLAKWFLKKNVIYYTLVHVTHQARIFGQMLPNFGEIWLKIAEIWQNIPGLICSHKDKIMRPFFYHGFFYHYKQKFRFHTS